jgi:hypothetical protein
MSKFPPPKFYATDKDVHDLLTRLNMESLVVVGKSRGLILSHNAPKDALVSYLAKQMFSHPQLHNALKLMEHEEKEEKTTPSKIDADVDMGKVAEAFGRVRDDRKDPDERMEITQRPSGELEVKHTYTHLDFAQTTLRQRTTKVTTFIVQKNGKVLDFDYNNTAKAAEIYSEVKTILKGEAPIAITEFVSLTGVQDNAKRIEFFLNLMNSVAGFRLRAVRDVKAERMAVAQTEGEGSDVDAQEEVEEMVKKMALNGGSVWTSPEFQSMVKNGFFVYNARWLGTELNGENRTVEFDAGFSTGECLDFSIRVLGFYKRNNDGGLEKKLTLLNSTDREAFRSSVQKSAFEAVEKVQPPKSVIAVPVADAAPADD